MTAQPILPQHYGTAPNITERSISHAHTHVIPLFAVWIS